jgi:phosphoenolpyruvate carboxykinase (GTP)
MAMLPFCGYNMADYFGHWLRMGKKLAHPPKIFTVNWFRTNDEGKYLWPGFGDNIRVLKWIVERVNNKVSSKETAIGLLPEIKDLDLTGLNIPQEEIAKLFEVNSEEWTPELKDIEKFLEQFGSRLPQEMREEYKKLSRDLKSKG